MSTTVETILLYTIGAGLLSIVYGFFTGKNILNQSTGNAKMQDIASAIQIGAKAYLARQYKTIAIVGVVVLVIVSFAFSPLVGLGYLVGAALSGIAGYVGMLIGIGTLSLIGDSLEDYFITDPSVSSSLVVSAMIVLIITIEPGFAPKTFLIPSSLVLSLTI